MMSELAVDITWERGEAEFKPGTFSNAHLISYDAHNRVRGDAAPSWGGDPAHTNPEQALAAALSSCHMMTFLALAAKTGWPVTRYCDRAVADLGKNDRGQMAVSAITLHPQVEFDAGFTVSDAKLADMHDRAHRYCFVANSLDAQVRVSVETA